MKGTLNGSVFAVCALALACCLALWLAPRSRPETDPPEHPGFVVTSSYADGYRSGFEAFRSQMGIPMPRDNATRANYTSGQDGGPDEFDRGYVDGYHRAAGLQSCPAGF